MSANRNSAKLCTTCVGSKIFKEWVRDNGQTGSCDYNSAHRGRFVVATHIFAGEVDDFFRKNFKRGEQVGTPRDGSDNMSYEEAGEPYKVIMRSELNCSEVLVDAISKCLPGIYGRNCFYEDMANYQSVDDIDEEYFPRPPSLDDAY